MTMTAYLRAAEAQRMAPRRAEAGITRLEELVRLATLAASSHNTQPWRFTLQSDEIRIHPDPRRRCPVVDPDDAHLWRSLGCATENIVLAAPVQGLAATVRVVDSAVCVALTPAATAEPDALVRAIPQRQCCKAPYDGRPLAADELAALDAAGLVAGARIALVTAGAQRSAVADLVAEGNRLQLADPAFRRELIYWMRFSDRDAVSTGDGLAGRVLGLPSIPGFVGRAFVRLFLSGRRQANADRRLIETSPVLAVVLAPDDGPEGWVAAGRASQRLQLQATALGLTSAFLNQPVEVPALRPRLEALLGLRPGERAHLLLRVGRGPRRPYSLRREPSTVMELLK
jgi:nitroreductase